MRRQDLTEDGGLADRQKPENTARLVAFSWERFGQPGECRMMPKKCGLKLRLRLRPTSRGRFFGTDDFLPVIPERPCLYAGPVSSPRTSQTCANRGPGVSIFPPCVITVHGMVTVCGAVAGTGAAQGFIATELQDVGARRGRARDAAAIHGRLAVIRFRDARRCRRWRRPTSGNSDDRLMTFPSFVARKAVGTEGGRCTLRERRLSRCWTTRSHAVVRAQRHSICACRNVWE